MRRTEKRMAGIIGPFTFCQMQRLWHPESPGSKVTTVRMLPWWRRSPFATPTEVLRHYSGVDRTLQSDGLRAAVVPPKGDPS